jgi:hypothetical protein
MFSGKNTAPMTPQLFSMMILIGVHGLDRFKAIRNVVMSCWDKSTNPPNNVCFCKGQTAKYKNKKSV